MKVEQLRRRKVASPNNGPTISYGLDPYLAFSRYIKRARTRSLASAPARPRGCTRRRLVSPWLAQFRQRGPERRPARKACLKANCFVGPFRVSQTGCRGEESNSQRHWGRLRLTKGLLARFWPPGRLACPKVEIIPGSYRYPNQDRV